MPERTRVGVVGCGLIAQVMHLPYLAELADRFELAALCDPRVRAVVQAEGIELCSFADLRTEGHVRS